MVSSLEDEIGIPLEFLLKLLKPLIQEVLRYDHIIGAIVWIDCGQVTAVTVHKVIQVLRHAPGISPPRILLQSLFDVHKLLQGLYLDAYLDAGERLGETIGVGLLWLQVHYIGIHPPARRKRVSWLAV